MIDFVRATFRDRDGIENFVTDPTNFKTLKTSLDYHSGEIEYPFKTWVGNVEIRVNEKSAYYKNSFHKLNNQLNDNMINGECHNSNDFCYSELCNTIEYLKSKIINIEETTLTQLEFGLNIETPVTAEYIVMNNILLHNLEIHSHKTGFDERGAYKQFDHYNYYIKVYDKAKQYKLDKNILRFEIKYKKNKGFNKFGIYNIMDLKDKGNLTLLMEDLLMRFDELTIVDDYTKNSNMTKTDINQLEKFLSYKFWMNISERKYKRNKAILKKKFEGLLVKNSLLKTKNFLRERLEEKFRELINK